MINKVMLEVSNVNKKFGGLLALSSVSLSIESGTIAGLIGPNGAGKTTFFNVMTGLYPADTGSFSLAGKSYNPRVVEEVVFSGIARTFQNIRLFKEMTVLENVMVGRHCRTKAGFWGATLRTQKTQLEEKLIFDRSLELLDYVGIVQHASKTSKNLSYGDQRRLEIARAMATDPLVLALDEPAAGMNATEKVELQKLLEKINSDGTTILMTEHDVKLVMGICHSITVLDHGEVIAHGTPDLIRTNPAVIEAYLGPGVA